jgi:hypothetical protein
LGTTPSTKLDTSSWKLPKDIKLADEHFNQPGSIDLLIGADIVYEILRLGKRTRPVISQFYKKQFLAGHFLVEFQLSHRMTHNIHFCYEKTTVWSTIQTAFGKWTRGAIHHDSRATSL